MRDDIEPRALLTFSGTVGEFRERLQGIAQQMHYERALHDDEMLFIQLVRAEAQYFHEDESRAAGNIHLRNTIAQRKSLLRTLMGRLEKKIKHSWYKERM